MPEIQNVNLNLKTVLNPKKRIKPKLSKKTESAFNLGACFLPCLYNFIYKRPYLALTFLILTAIPHTIDRLISAEHYLYLVYFVSLMSIVLAIYSGLSGNKSAYNSRDYDNETDFIKSQRFWIAPVILAIIIHLVLLPVQITGHYNAYKMIKFAQAKDTLKKALIEGTKDDNVIGVNTFYENIPAYFERYTNGKLQGTDLYMPNGIVYNITGYVQECGTVRENSYYGEKSACATIKIDLRDKKDPNTVYTSNLDTIKNVFNTTKLDNYFVIYAYGDDLMPKEGSIEQYILRRFERN